MFDVEATATKLRLIVRLINRRAQAETGVASPTFSEHAVLSWLAERGPLTASALSRLEVVRPQSMTQTLDSLEERSWVKRDRDPIDRRQIIVSLTAEGDAALSVGRALRQAWFTEAMRNELDEAQRRLLGNALDLLERMLRVPRERDHGQAGGDKSNR